jgi:putative addiction module component (TIGR02574 family)
MLWVMDLKQLLAEALQLSPEERAALAGELIQSLDPQVDEEAEAAWSLEIRRRLDRLDAGLATTVPWAEARRRILAAGRRASKP